MGQEQSTPSQPNISDVYSSYISQQQRLIQLQQQQINNLYKMNLDQSSNQMKVPTNIAFQQQQQQHLIYHYELPNWMDGRMELRMGGWTDQ